MREVINLTLTYKKKIINLTFKTQRKRKKRKRKEEKEKGEREGEKKERKKRRRSFFSFPTILSWS